MDPHFLYLLQCNDPPSEPTVNEVKELLIEPSQELSETDAEIERLDKIMEALKEKREGIQKTINSYNTILSPSRRIPADILHEIFYHCLPTHRNPIMNASEGPVLLTRICSRWRTAALSSPRIWAKIHIPLPGSPRDTFLPAPPASELLQKRVQALTDMMQLRCQIVKEWLGRSGDCPLSLSLSYPDFHSFPGPGMDEVDFTHDIFKTILPFAQRWKSLELTMPSLVYEKLQMLLSAQVLPSLENLRANISERHPRSETDNKPFGLITSPKLKQLTLHSMRATGNFRDLPPVWNRLTYLCIHSMFPETDVLDLLAQCGNLVDCKLYVMRTWGDEVFEASLSSLILPFLKTLSIHDGGSSSVMMKVFGAISAPALNAIEYRKSPYYPPHGDGFESIPISFFTLLEGSPGIGRLSLEPSGMLPHDILQCFRISTGTTHLILGQEPFYPTNYPLPVTISADPFDLMNLSIGMAGELGDILLPNLEILEAYQLSSFTDENLIKLITARLDSWKGGQVAALKHVKVEFQREKRNADVEEVILRYAKSVGVEMKLELIYIMAQPKNFEPLSSSFGLSEDGRSWTSVDIVESVVH